MKILRHPWRSLPACAAALACSLALVGCSQSQMLDKLSTPEDRALAQTVIRDLEAGPSADADLLSRIEPSLKPKLPNAVVQIRSAMPRGPGLQVRLVDASFSVRNVNGQTSRLSNLAYELDAAGKHALVRIQILRQGPPPQVTSLYLTSLPGTVEQLGGFSLSGKSSAQYVILALTVLSLITILASEVVLVRTRRIPLKWLWFLGCLFGYGQIAVDWSSGAIGFTPLYIQLLGASAVKMGVLAPWRVGFGVPVVSLIFLVLRRKIQRPKPEPASAFG